MVGSVAFIPPSLGRRFAEIDVAHIFIGALAPGPAIASGKAKTPTLPGALTNHWVIHLIQSSGRSVRLDPSPSGPGDAPITIIFSEFDRGVPRDLVRTFDLTVKPELTLDALLDVVVRGRFKQYKFDASGQGCRYWIWCFLSFLKENGIVDSAFLLDGARVCMQQVWTEGGLLAE